MRLLLLIVLFVYGRSAYSQTVSGKLTDTKQNKPIAYASVLLFSKENTRRAVMSDQGGAFTFKGVKPGKYSITISSTEYRDTTFSNILVDGDTALHLTYYNYCQYDYSLNNRTCPKCNKRNAVIPIMYGLPVSTDGEDPQKLDGIKYILAGCETTGCDPHWYCKRDKLSF